MPLKGRSLICTLAVAVAMAVAALQARIGTVTTPKEQFGFALGDDYMLANYQQLTQYWKKLDGESDRMTLVEIGRTAEGRSQLMAVVTSPENHKKLARYKEISRRLALAEGLDDESARALAAEGRAVVWVDGGLHASEVLGGQQLMELVFQMVSRNDEETQRFLRDVILLAVHANPDGHDLVADWYMREADPKQRMLSGLPRLYHKYIGHDNNRDSYMSTQPETTNMNRVLYREWFPQIMYNHHQTGPPGTVLFAPPFRDPFNYVFDPLIPLGIDLVGAAMHGRFAAEDKPGATMRRGADYSTWWNGGLRTTAYYHNMIGLLTETIGNPTPMEIPFVTQRVLPSSDLPFPIAPQKWHFRQSIEYSITANRAVLDVASRHREQFLFNIYKMGRNSIDRGSRDHWTMYPRRVKAMQEAVARETGDQRAPMSAAMSRGGRLPPAPVKYYDLLRDPQHRDPRGYVLPSDQRDFPTAIKFANTLIKNGVTVHRATAAFDVGGKRYPAGSLVVKTAQAFRPHVLDMFEPQDHPDDPAYPGGPPIPPYDSAGWTLAYQMGVTFDRILEGFEGPFEAVTDLIAPVPTAFPDTSDATGYLLSHAQNDAFVAVNRVLKNGGEAYLTERPNQDQGSQEAPRGIYVPASAKAREILRDAARTLGISVTPATRPPAGSSGGPATATTLSASTVKLRPVRVGLWDRYGGSMPSGWVRWLLEQYEFPFEVVYPPALDAGDLRSKFDVLIFVDGAIPAGGRGEVVDQALAARIPAEYRRRMGSVTTGTTIPQLKTFVEQGGTILAIGNSTSLASHLGLPLTDALVERTPTGDRSLPREKYFVPGSVLRVAVDNRHPLAWGMERQADVMFDNSPAFRLLPDAPARGVRAVAWFDSDKPLRSGWAWGQHHLEGAVAVAEAPVGKGRVFLFGPEITFRAQPHGTFKFLFNGIYYGAAAGDGAAVSPSTAP